MKPPAYSPELQTAAIDVDQLAEAELAALTAAPRIEVLTTTSPGHAAAVIAAVESFLSETASTSAENGSAGAQVNGHMMSGWHRAAIKEAVHARQLHHVD